LAYSANLKLATKTTAFELLNLGKYQREHFVNVDASLDDKHRAQQKAAKEQQFVKLILAAYKAESVQGFETISGQKAGRLVAIGPIDMAATRDLIAEILEEVSQKQISKVDLLAFEYEMNLGQFAQEEAKKVGVDLALKVIPPDVFDKRAVEKNQVKFYDVAYIEVKPHYVKKSVAIELTDFSVFYSQDIDESELKPGAIKVVIRDGQVVKLHKDKDSAIIDYEVLTKEWTDWIDYWSVDFNYEDRKEFVRRKKKNFEQIDLEGDLADNKLQLKEYEEHWTGGYIFENEWQSFRTKKDRKIELKSVYNEYLPGKKYKIAVKVIDIFGNDTMKVIEVNI
jgi:hypothetical protein